MHEVPFFACCDLINGLLSDLTPSGRSEPRSAVFLVPLLASPIGVVLSTGMPWRCADSVLFWRKYSVAVRLLFVFAYCAAASFCIKSIPCASCVDMLTHVAFGGRAASCPEGHRSGIGKEGLVGQWTRWTKRCCPKWCQNLSQTLPRPQKIVAVVGPCWTDPQGPRPARCSVDLCFSVSHCHCTQISRTCEAWQSFNSWSANPWLLYLLSGSDLHESQVMVINSHSHY